MSKLYIALLSLGVCVGGHVNAQKGHFLTGSIAAGPNYYFNNIKTFGEDVKPVNYGIFGRLLWNSKYAVSLGVETGYNKFYRVASDENTDVKAALVSIPFHLVIGMRITRSFYTNFSFGPSLLLNSANNGDQHLNNKVLSFADGSFDIGYRKKLSEKFSLGAELKFNFSTKAADMNIALPIVLSYIF